jgi:uncharacterized surface protein with fasciclin (FAS1) repeats
VPAPRTLPAVAAGGFALAPIIGRTPDIAATIAADGRFTTLVAALDAAGLLEAMREPGPTTLLAPTDAAFAALPAGTIEEWLDPAERRTLTAMLNRHIVAGEVDAATAASLRAANGVVHVLDRVVLS